jgi:hypothetical protein
MIEKFSIPRQRAGDSTSDLGLVWESVEWPGIKDIEVEEFPL